MEHQEPIPAIPRNLNMTDGAPMLKRSFAIERDDMPISSSGHIPVLSSPPPGRRSTSSMKNSDVLIVDSHIASSSGGGGRVEELERQNRKQADKINDLEIALAEARKIIKTREALLTKIQWEPKDDFYVYKNPKIESSKLESDQERKMQLLMEQMRIMEKIINERDQDTTELINQLAESGALAPEQVPQSLATSQHMSESPAIRNLNTKGHASSPLWMRSPTGSPNVDRKKTWWNFNSKKASSGSIVAE